MPVFHNKNTFNTSMDQYYCRLKKDEQIMEPKSCGRGFVISMFVCLCYGRMIDPDTGEPSRVMLNYGNNCGVYWTVEDVARNLEEVHVTFLKLCGVALDL